MRHGRAKAARKTLQFFQRTIGIKPPYHILLDGTFIVAIVKYNLPLHERLDRLLQHAPLQLCITESSLIELETLQANIKQHDKVKLINKAHKWAKNNCHKILLEIPPKEDVLESMVDPKTWDKLSTAGRDVLCLVAQHKSKVQDTTQRYFVASQDDELLHVVRQHHLVPVIRLARGSVLLLEQPSKAANQQATKQERHKWSASITDQEKSLVDVVKEQQQRQQQSSTRPVHHQRRKRKAKGPNPLSCKTKKTNKNTDSTKPKRKRRRMAKDES